MISSRRTKIAAVVGLAVLFATALLFFQLFRQQEAIHWVALAFIVVGELLPVAGFVFFEDAPILSFGPASRIGVYSLLLVYGLVAILLAILFLVWAGSPYWLASLEFALLLLFGGGAVLAAGGSAGRTRRSRESFQAAASMRGLVEEVLALGQNPANRPYERQLIMVEEAIRYCDHAGRSAADDRLAAAIADLGSLLQDRVDEDRLRSVTAAFTEAKTAPETKAQVEAKTAEILALVRERAQEVRRQKKEQMVER